MAPLQQKINVLVQQEFSTLKDFKGPEGEKLLPKVHATLTPGGASASVTVSLNALASSLPMGIYADTIRFTNLLSGAGLSRTFTLRVGQPDYYTELFDSADNDLSYQTFTFTPDGSTSFYSACREPASSFPTDPSGGTTVNLTDDSSTPVTLAGTNTVGIYNRRSRVFYIGSNGYLTLDSGDTEYVESFAHHFDLPRVAAVFDDLNPGVGGTISWKQTSELVAVTFTNVSEYGSSAFRSCGASGPSPTRRNFNRPPAN